MDDSGSRRPDRRYPFLAALLVLLAAFPSAAQEEAPPVFEGAGGTVDSYKTFKSGDGRFTVVCTSSPEAAGMVRWVSETISRLERKTGLTIPYTRKKPFRIVVHFDAPPDTAAAKPAVTELNVFGVRTDALILRDFLNLKREDVMEGLCELLLGGIMKARSRTGNQKPAVLPGWFVSGISQNLYETDRGRNNRKVLKRWREGDVVDLSSVLSGAEDDMVMDWAVTAWLLSCRADVEIVDELVSHCASGGNIDTEWLSSRLFPDDPDADPGSRWDYWMYSRKNSILELGRLDAELMSELDSELLIYRGTYGIPWDDEMGNALSLGHLIRYKSESWMPVLCEKKSADIRLLGLGKDKEFAAVTDLYCGFLVSLGRGSSGWRLKGLLKKADAARAALEKRVEDGQKENN